MTKLKAYLKAEGISGSKFAKLADMHNSSISAILSGKLEPYPGQYRKIEKAVRSLGYNGDIDELFEKVD